MKTQIAVELRDQNLKGLDFRFPEKGNPGIGGSEYLFLLLARYLEKHYGNMYEITIFHYNQNELPENVNDVIVEDEAELINKVQRLDNPILIHQIAKTEQWYKEISQTGIKDMPWAHCYLKYNEVKAINACENVRCVVFVGKEEYDAYLDDDIIEKSVCIYNMLNTKNVTKVRDENFSKTVTYMGSLVPEKGFHLLAKVWPNVLQKVPDAQLRVIGSGKLYDRTAALGRFGIAEENYEDLFMKYLVDSKGDVLPGVNFLGLVGTEKEDYFVDSAVGVVNPLAKDETFCLSAVEMELCGVPIVTKKKYGLLDTIAHQETGLLFKNEKEFEKYLILLLEDKALNIELGRNAPIIAREKFDVETVIKEWNAVLQNVNLGVNAQFEKTSGNYGNDFKWIRVMIRFIRFSCGFRFVPSFNNLKYIIKNILKRV